MKEGTAQRLGTITATAICILLIGAVVTGFTIGKEPDKGQVTRALPRRPGTPAANSNKPYITRKAKVTKVVDGDTIDVMVDLGIEVFRHTRLRIRGIDTPELRSSDPEEKKRAKEAKEFVKKALLDKNVTLRLWHPGKYGRWIADVLYHGPNGDEGPLLDLSEELLAASLAEKYPRAAGNP